MRLTPHQVAVIRREVAALVHAQAEVRLFGSRVQDGLRGGDIDLWVSSPVAVPNRVLLAAQLVARLQMTLGDQRIDVRLVDPATEPASIDAVACREGVLL